MIICIDYDTSLKLFCVSTDLLDLAEYVVQSSLWSAENVTVDFHHSLPRCQTGIIAVMDSTLPTDASSL